jgi:hypothetical protein
MGMIGSRAIAPITAAGTDFLLRRVFSHRSRRRQYRRRRPNRSPFNRIIPLWAKQTNAPKKGKQDMETKCGRLAEWLGHDDMARVGFENCRDYRDAVIDEGDLSSGSILNHVKLLKALFTYAFDNEHITSNPMARVKYRAGDRKERDDFTPDERKLILAREAEPHVYWVNWFCSFLGTRTSEVADASTLDIEYIDGIWVMSIHRKHRSRDQRLKTKVSTRKLALHLVIARPLH